MSLMSVHQTCYREAKPVTDDIRRHCHILFDEGLFINALNLLNSILTVGADQPKSLNKPAFAPLPLHIELVSVLLIHPRYNNQAGPGEYSEIASRSIIFLRNVLSILGPINANLAEVFAFNFTRSSNLSRKDRYAHPEVKDQLNGSDSEDKGGPIRTLVANNGRTRKCAKDFWHIVGWSFNCSVRYPKRWKYLKVWLDYMIDVLDTDMKERNLLDLKSIPAGYPTGSRHPRSSSKPIFLSYISGYHLNSTAIRRVVKSIFADGEKESLTNFPEVFPNETKILKAHNGHELKKQNFSSLNNIEFIEEEQNEVDLTDDDSDEEYVSKIKGSYGENWIGGTQSIILRQRLITLLSSAVKNFPTQSIGCSDLYAIIYDHIRSLPLSIFTIFITSSKSSHISDAVYVPLCQTLLSRLLPKSAPSPSSVKSLSMNGPLSQILLEQCYLPFAALSSSSQDNAKVSIIVENLLRLLLRKNACHYSPELEIALEKGIVAREEKVKMQKKRDQNIRRIFDEDDAWLKASSMRLRSLLLWLKNSCDRMASK